MPPVRGILGSTPRTRWRRPWYSSLTISPIVSSRLLRKRNGRAKNVT